MMEYKEDDFLSLAGLQHFAFCRRQWALIHIENQWADNLRTIEGNILHENAHDDGFTEKRGSIVVSRGMPVFSAALGITGVCDVVEFHQDPCGVSINGWDGSWLPLPVEYKKGAPKEHRADEMQLCCQGMCLEDMLLCSIEKGYLYYGETRHRTEVLFDDELRQLVRETVREMHECYDRRYTPKVKISKRCRACSLANICLPKLCNKLSVSDYLDDRIGEIV